MTDNDYFSVREGFEPPKVMQTNDLDKDARTALYNAVEAYFPRQSINKDRESLRKHKSFWNHSGRFFFKMRTGKIFKNDSIHLSDGMNREYENMFSNDKWYRILDYVEYLSLFILITPSFSYKKNIAHNFSRKINKALKQENVDYSFVEGKFIPNINEEEIQAIEQAATSPYENAREHINKAINLFSDRQNPDYANSIKESISAVESVAVEITDENNFDNAIKQLKDSGVKLHTQFEKAIKNMYQFTSDDDGIRHAKPIDDPATARYMLVTCSAIVNFIADSKKHHIGDSNE